MSKFWEKLLKTKIRVLEDYVIWIVTIQTEYTCTGTQTHIWNGNKLTHTQAHRHTYLYIIILFNVYEGEQNLGQ